jgi:hypothetical protein
MKQAIMLGVLAIALASAGLEAQGRNFGGTWVIDTEKTQAASGGVMESRVIAEGAVRSTGDRSRATAAGAGGGGGGAIAGAVTRTGGGGATVTPGLSVTLDANTFSVVNAGMTTTYKLDGSVSTVESRGRQLTAKASWRGDKIAIETTMEGPDGPIVTHATWYLEGDSLVRENKSTDGAGQEVVRKTYYKRS